MKRDDINTGMRTLEQERAELEARVLELEADEVEQRARNNGTISMATHDELKHARMLLEANEKRMMAMEARLCAQ